MNRRNMTTLLLLLALLPQTDPGRAVGQEGGIDQKVRVGDEGVRLADRVVLALAFSPDSKRLVVGREGAVELWDVDRQAMVSSAKFKQDVTSVAFLDNGFLVATIGHSTVEKVGEYGEVLELDKDFKVKKKLAGQYLAVRSGNGTYVVEGKQDSDGIVSLITDKGKKVLANDLPGFVCSLAVSDETVAAGTGGRVVRLFKRKTNEITELPVQFRTTINCLSFLDKNLVVVEWSGGFSLWSATGKLLKSFPANATCVTAGRDTVVIGTKDGAVEGYRLTAKDGPTFHHANAHKGPIYAVALSPNGKWIASGGYDGKVVFIPWLADKK